MTGDVPKMVQFGPKTAKHDRLVNVPKWFKRVQKRPKLSLTIWEPFGTIWALLFRPFQTKIEFWLQSTFPRPYFVLFGPKKCEGKEEQKTWWWWCWIWWRYLSIPPASSHSVSFSHESSPHPPIWVAMQQKSSPSWIPQISSLSSSHISHFNVVVALMSNICIYLQFTQYISRIFSHIIALEWQPNTSKNNQRQIQQNETKYNAAHPILRWSNSDIFPWFHIPVSSPIFHCLQIRKSIIEILNFDCLIQ